MTTHETSFTFDQIMIIPSNRPSQTLNPPTLAYDRKSIYAGGPNWKIDFKNLHSMDESTSRRTRTISRGRIDSNGEMFTLSLVGGLGGGGGGGKNKKNQCSMQCEIETSGMSARQSAQLDEFIDGMKRAHRKVCERLNWDDPYANEERSGGRMMTKTGRCTTSRGRSSAQRVPTITPSRTQSSLYMHKSPGKKRVDRSFASPDRKRGTSAEDASSQLRGNVVVNETTFSPERRRTMNFLPPKSPRNATPAKLLRDEDDEENNHYGGSSDGKSRSLFGRSQLSGISGGNIKLRKKKHSFGFSDEEFDSVDDRRKKEEEDSSLMQDEEMGSVNGGGDEDRLEESDQEEELVGRKRLKKTRRSIAEDDDSDVEFDIGKEAVESGSKCKKKLRLSLEDNNEEKDEATICSPSSNDATKELLKKVNSGKSVEGRESPLASTAAGEETAESKGSSVAGSDKSNTSKAKAISNFFNPRGTSKAKAFAETKRPSPKSDTYGNSILMSPAKKNKAAGATTATPSTPPESQTKATPVLKQVQRVKSRYFEDASGKRSPSPMGNRFDYTSEQEDTLPGYGDDGAYFEDTIAKEDSPYQTTFQKASNLLDQARSQGRIGRQSYGRQTYGSKPKNPYKVSTLGRPRLAPSPPQLDVNRSLFGKDDSSTADCALGSSKKGSIGSWKMSNSFTRAIDAIDEQSNVPGIQNLGNTCYLSASLQTLFSIPDFLRELYESYVTELAKQKEMPLTKALLEVAVAIGVLSEESTPKISSENAQSKLLSSKAANPTALKKQMDVLTDKFVGYEQRDAHEFLSDLVDFLHDELIASSEYGETKIEAADGLEIGELKSGDSTEENATKEISGEEKKSSNLPPTDEYFRLTVRVRLTCDSCKYSR
jgi:hypothetical protein